ncbi:PilZ domain-containing protein [Thermodesulfobacteriota bacterium]
MEVERRLSSRMASQFSVDIWGRSGGNEITDFSPGGAFIRMGGVFSRIADSNQRNDTFTFAAGASQLKEGDKIDLILKFPTQKVTMSLKAEIRRVTDEGVGVKFSDLTPEKNKVIKDCFEAYKDEKSSAREQSAPMKAKIAPEVGEGIWNKLSKRVQGYVKVLKK